MMAQYRRIKGELPPGTLLLFRLGDFYEMFFEDAQAGAQLLNVALTRRGSVPMCGIPYHAANGYIGRLLKSGRKVAICDQVEDARKGQLVRREVTQVLSPGTHFDERLLVSERNNFLAAIHEAGGAFGLAFADLTTGDFRSTELPDEAALWTELQRVHPAEILFPTGAGRLRDLLQSGAATPGSRAKSSPETPPDMPTQTSFGWIINGYEDWTFAPETAIFTIRDQFKVAALDGFGLKDRPAAIGAAGALLHYVTQQLRRDVSGLTRISFYQRTDFLALDHTTLRHLEILEPLRQDASQKATLQGALNRTVTPMGARRLRDWLSQPLSTRSAIQRRQETVSLFLENVELLESTRTALQQVRDLERTISRIGGGGGNGRDLAALRAALEQLPTLKLHLVEAVQAWKGPSKASEPPALPWGPKDQPRSTGSDTSEPAAREAWSSGDPIDPHSHPLILAELAHGIIPCPEIADLIARSIVDEPPLALKEGGIIRDGFDAALDELREASRGGKDWIARLQQEEIERTGIGSLKIRFNSVFGYYVEVTRSNLDKVPPHYIRKQTIANGERFITPELKEMEGKILGAEERSMKLEYELFQKVRESVVGRLRDILETAGALAQVDVLASFAQTARLFNYCRPEIGDEGVLHIVDGRHPVLEQNLGEEPFVPNDTHLDAATQIALITGPNMAGKSTYIRQTALLALLAHTGSFLPAARARIDLLDRIFTRIGASDDLARGQSTFMVEMCETANILNNATPRSLIILDEIGRGTSTFDGLSLAWSILEFLHNQVGAKTLFATHYHELTELAGRLARVKNYNVAVREWNDQVVFLRKIVEGGTDKSYGIQVARLAGVPKSVLDRAREILHNLEESELTPEGNVRQVNRRQRDRDKLKQLAPAPQLDLFT